MTKFKITLSSTFGYFLLQSVTILRQVGTATDEMMELLSALVRYGVSTTVAGATSSGKTTLTGWLLTTIPMPVPKIYFVKKENSAISV